jgi:hypothetical protein
VKYGDYVSAFFAHRVAHYVWKPLHQRLPHVIVCHGVHLGSVSYATEHVLDAVQEVDAQTRSLFLVPMICIGKIIFGFGLNDERKGHYRGFHRKPGFPGTGPNWTITASTTMINSPEALP